MTQKTTWHFKRVDESSCKIYSSCGQYTRWFYGELAAHAAQDFWREVDGMTAKEAAEKFPV